MRIECAFNVHSMPSADTPIYEIVFPQVFSMALHGALLLEHAQLIERLRYLNMHLKYYIKSISTYTYVMSIIFACQN